MQSGLLKISLGVAQQCVRDGLQGNQPVHHMEVGNGDPCSRKDKKVISVLEITKMS